MKKPGNPSSAGLQVRASELAQMGVCERLVVFEQCYGKRRTLAQRQAIQCGLHAHQRFYRDRHLNASANRHFVIASRIASVLYGWLRRAMSGTLWSIRWCLAVWAKGGGRSDGT